jgi:cellulose synthase (UDP-forming)
VRRTLYAAERMLRNARKEPSAARPEVRAALDSVHQAVRRARRQLGEKGPLAEITYEFQQSVDAAARAVVAADVEEIRADLDAIAAMNGESGGGAGVALFDDATLAVMSSREWSPLGALQSIQALARAVDVDRADEAQPMLPIATFSVTEDMATCMRLHAAGWNSAYHNEILANGLAPDDVRTMLAQRLRWAQGTVQVMLRENPLAQKGLGFGQRLMYFATMWSYLAGFAAVAYMVAPDLYLVFGVMPVKAYSWDFFGRLIPFLVLNQLMFIIISHGHPTWRGQQYSLALFPIWIKACYTAVLNVAFGRPLSFTVTPKGDRADRDSVPWRLMKWQFLAMGFLVAASVIGMVQLYLGRAVSVLGVGVNVLGDLQSGHTQCGRPGRTSPRTSD